MRQISVGNWNTHLCRGHRICLYFFSVLKLNGKPTLKMAELFGRGNSMKREHLRCDTIIFWILLARFTARCRSKKCRKCFHRGVVLQSLVPLKLTRKGRGREEGKTLSLGKQESYFEGIRRIGQIPGIASFRVQSCQIVNSFEREIFWEQIAPTGS